VWNAVVELDVVNHLPNLGVLHEILHRKTLLGVYLANPKFILQITNLQGSFFFLFCNFKFFGSNILGPHVLYPSLLPKEGFVAIAHGDRRSHRENIRFL
jgi:hypothetical protein